MRVLSFKPGHDGTAAFLDDGHLVFSLEGEKDSFIRNGPISAPLVVEALELAGEWPDVVAIGGWNKLLPGFNSKVGAGYVGLGRGESRDGRLFGRGVRFFTSSHERSHLFMVAAMAPGAPLDECAILIWEGHLGALYHWREHGASISRTTVLSQPGSRYGALFALADPGFPDHGRGPPVEAAGKLMALAGFADTGAPHPEDDAVIERLLELDILWPFDKGAFRGTRLYNAGVHTPVVHRAAARLGDRLFAIFRDAAERALPRGLPLLISGGCGLNCEWNVRWRDSGLFTDVFVPPCANDSGSAIGTAVDAAVEHGGKCAIEWSVYSGAPFHFDQPAGGGWTRRLLAPAALAERLAAGDVVAWVEGRCEIGPRALGHRSLLATPLAPESHRRLNAIKGRELYRPIAPCCLAEDLDRHFDPPIDDPFMLHFSRVSTSALPAITHVDGTARVQSVRAVPHGLRALLEAFRDRTGYGVLCNTSLNFPGTGFINRTSELFAYAELRGIEHVVVDSDWYCAQSR